MTLRHALFFLAVFAVPVAALADQPDGGDFFEKRVRPILVEHCYKCHGPEAKEPGGNLRLDSKAGWAKGGDTGPAIIPGEPDKSLLVKAIRRQDGLEMPPDNRLAEVAVEDLVSWVKQGAPDPRIAEAPAVEKPAYDYDAERAKWAFKAPADPAPPDVRDGAWPINAIDRFVLARLEAENIKPAKPAEAATLARRLYFDLVGLPPSPEEVEAFVVAASRDRRQAVSKLVDRLLASPQYGEKWARHWLDVVRYADSLDARTGGKPGDILDAWRYRDWVVNSLNADLPYDQFVRHQVAGDILADHDWAASKVVATGMYAIGNWGNGDSDKKKIHTDIVDDQIDVTSRAFMGLTVACARCHDHKFDPITTADYYSLAGIFFSSHIVDRFNGPGEGENLMRISVLSPEEKVERERALARIAAIGTELDGGLRPLDREHSLIAGNADLTGWTAAGADNPSLVVNRSNDESRYITITLAARSICLHPGPKVPVTAVWRSPVAGKVLVSVKLRDADATGGDGIEWFVRHGAKDVAQGAMDNGGAIEAAEKEIDVEAGDLVRLVIAPRSEYTCDSTQVEFVIREPNAGGRVWDLRAALLGPATDMARSAWLVCSGDAERFPDQPIDRKKLAQERELLKKQTAQVVQCQGMQEGGVPGTAYEGLHDAPIHVRGSYNRLGDPQSRGFPVLFGESPVRLTGSGRLQLAEWLTSPSHPLTARVLVNRLWQHHFGEGIVRTPNNFGKLGEAPTHPELLDWLAHRFVESGWSMKAVHRLICESATYQQASMADADVVRADPENRLLGRQNRRRLTAEQLRDSLLAVTGVLDASLGGPAVAEVDSHKRTLYLRAVRSDRATYQVLFDGPESTSILERRTESIVAPQALWLLNHPFVQAEAAALAARLEREGPQDAAGRLGWLARRLFARGLRPEEERLLLGAAANFGDDAKGWERMCHALLCSNEFTFVD